MYHVGVTRLCQISKIGDEKSYRPLPHSLKRERLQAIGACVACPLNSSETTKASMSDNVLAKTVLLLQATILGRFG